MGNSCKIYTSRDILIGPIDKLDREAQLVFNKIVAGVKKQDSSASPYIIGLIMIRDYVHPNFRWRSLKSFETAWWIHSLAVCRPEVGEEDLLDSRFNAFWRGRAFYKQLTSGCILYHVGRSIVELCEQDCCPLTSVMAPAKDVLKHFPRLSALPKGNKAKVLWTMSGFVDYAPGIDLGLTLCESWITAENSVRAMGRASLLAYFKEIFGNDSCFVRKNPTKKKGNANGQ